MAKLALALALAPAVTAFAPVAAPKAATKVEASIADTLASMEGPEIFWGSAGVLLGHDEADTRAEHHAHRSHATSRRSHSPNWSSQVSPSPSHRP